jgi:hypothetical protein
VLIGKTKNANRGPRTPYPKLERRSQKKKGEGRKKVQPNRGPRPQKHMELVLCPCIKLTFTAVNHRHTYDSERSRERSFQHPVTDCAQARGVYRRTLGQTNTAEYESSQTLQRLRQREWNTNALYSVCSMLQLEISVVHNIDTRNR